MNLLALSIFFFVLFLDILKSIYLQLEWKWILMTILLKKFQKKKREYFKIQGSIWKILNNKNWTRNFLSMQVFTLSWGNICYIFFMNWVKFSIQGSTRNIDINSIGFSLGSTWSLVNLLELIEFDCINIFFIHLNI
jgi:hypothetical protein